MTTTIHPTRELVRHRDVSLYLVMVVCSTAAFAMQATAVGAVVYARTHSKLDLGLTGLAEFIPTALLVLLTGSLADRFDRRRIVALSLVGETLVALVIARVSTDGANSLAPFILTGLCYGTLRSFHAPAGRALTPSIPPPAMMPRFMAMYSTTFQVSAVVGPVVGGFVYRAGPEWVFRVVAALYLTAAALVLLVRRRPVERVPERPTLTTAIAGLRFIRATPILLGAISLDLMAVLFGGAVALLPVFASDILHVDAAGLGLLRAAGGVGAFLTGFILAFRPVQRRVGHVLFVAVGVFGAASIAFGLSRSFPLSLLLLAIIGASDMVSVYIRSTLVPTVTPDDRRGRVLAVEMVFIGASNELGAFESGVAAAAIGTVPAVVVGGACTLGVVVLWPRLFPSLARVDRFSDAGNVAAPRDSL